MDLFNLGLVGLKTIQLPGHQYFDLNFINSQENQCNDQYSSLDSTTNSVVETENDNLEEEVG